MLHVPAPVAQSVEHHHHGKVGVNGSSPFGALFNIVIAAVPAEGWKWSNIMASKKKVP